MEESLQPLEQKSEDAPRLNSPLARLIGPDFVNPDGVVYGKRCKLCNSPLRIEAEKMFEARVAILAIKTFLEDNGLIVSPVKITHHMNEHYRGMVRHAILADYCDNLQSLMCSRRDRIEELEMLSKVAMLELARAISVPTNGDLTRERERLDMVSKAHRMMKESIQSINEMEDGDAKNRAMQLQFIKIWRDKIVGAKTEEERIMLISMLDDFKRALDGTQPKELKS